MRNILLHRIALLALLVSFFLLSTTAFSSDVKFASPVYYPASSETTRVVVADVNQDGKLDLVVDGYNHVGGFNDVTVLLGNGDGTFSPATSITHNVGPFSLAVADFDKDLRTDFVSSNGTELLFYKGNGDATFQAPIGSTLPLGARDTVNLVADFNQDHLPDLSFGNYVMLGDGAGSFGFPVALTSGGTINAIADFNGDSFPDLLQSIGNTYSIALGTGTGSFLAPTEICSACGLVGSVTAADFNNDGKMDIAGLVVESGNTSVHFTTLLGNGDGTFQPFISEAASWPTIIPSGYALGDFTSLGNLGLSAIDTRGSSYAFVATGVGNGTFTRGADLTLEGYWAYDIAVGDFNGDNAIDVAVAKGDNCAMGQDDSAKHCGIAVSLNMRGTFVTVDTSANPSIDNKKVCFTATVVASVDKTRKPSGTVIFTVNGIAIGAAKLKKGTAVLGREKLTSGTHQIVAYYMGDTNFNPNWSVTLEQSVLDKRPKKH